MNALWCNGCKTFLPDERFCRNSFATTRRFRQWKCKACTREYNRTHDHRGFEYAFEQLLKNHLRRMKRRKAA